MRKLVSVLLLVAYTAFAPVCFASSLGNVHQAHANMTMQAMHEVLSDCIGHNCHTTPQAPLAEHATMYSTATSANLAQSATILPGVLLLVFFLSESLPMLRARARAHKAALLAWSSMALRARVNHAKTYLRFLSMLIASPNHSYALA